MSNNPLPGAYRVVGYIRPARRQQTNVTTGTSADLAPFEAELVPDDHDREQQQQQQQQPQPQPQPQPQTSGSLPPEPPPVFEGTTIQEIKPYHFHYLSTVGILVLVAVVVVLSLALSGSIASKDVSRDQPFSSNTTTDAFVKKTKLEEIRERGSIRAGFFAQVDTAASFPAKMVRSFHGTRVGRYLKSNSLVPASKVASRYKRSYWT